MTGRRQRGRNADGNNGNLHRKRKIRNPKENHKARGNRRIWKNWTIYWLY